MQSMLRRLRVPQNSWRQVRRRPHANISAINILTRRTRFTTSFLKLARDGKSTESKFSPTFIILASLATVATGSFLLYNSNIGFLHIKLDDGSEPRRALSDRVAAGAKKLKPKTAEETREIEGRIKQREEELARHARTYQRSIAAQEQERIEKKRAELESIWGQFAEFIPISPDGSFVDFTASLNWLPDWAADIPAWWAKVQREINMEPGTLSMEIWEESKDPNINPEVLWDARVRISDELCDEEQAYLRNRKKHLRKALAKYLDIFEWTIHDDDIPTIAITGSGGGLRAMVAGAGSLGACKAAGLFDCVTYLVGVSGSCWLLTLYYSIGQRSFSHVIEHLKSRLQTHIAYPPAVMDLISSAPTNKYLLRGIVEKHGFGYASFGLVDLYGLLLAARLLVPKNEFLVNDVDMRLSSQRRYIDKGEQPLPIYCAVRHEIPGLGGEGEEQTETPADYGLTTDEAKKQAKEEAWFEWAEMTCYEFFMEELGAGIPTYALGRQFYNGYNVSRIPEMKLPTLLGMWGSAFCATLSHYYAEVRPMFTSFILFQELDKMMQERNEDLVKVHPIEPAAIPNYVLGLKDSLPNSVPASVHRTKELQLMDAGMSNNLATYPLLRPGRDVDIVIAFDNSADIKVANWISLTEGYAKQRGVRGWPVGIGWPREGDLNTEAELSSAMESSSAAESEEKLKKAQEADPGPKTSIEEKRMRKEHKGLGYLTIWVGTKEERESDEEPPPSKAIQDDHWELAKPEAGITIAYFPLIPNEKVPGVDPEVSEWMSTWNFEYTPEQVDKTVALATANFKEGEEQIKRAVRAVYERKKRLRIEKEKRKWRKRLAGAEIMS
ncbi:Lysophospholipase [Dactylella cylindrospora]|nr:Lysophospholipase [Dactylella cylindrospora]